MATENLGYGIAGANYRRISCPSWLKTVFALVLIGSVFLVLFRFGVTAQLESKHGGGGIFAVLVVGSFAALILATLLGIISGSSVVFQGVFMFWTGIAVLLVVLELLFDSSYVLRTGEVRVLTDGKVVDVVGQRVSRGWFYPRSVPLPLQQEVKITVINGVLADTTYVAQARLDPSGIRRLVQATLVRDPQVGLQGLRDKLVTEIDGRGATLVRKGVEKDPLPTVSIIHGDDVIEVLILRHISMSYRFSYE